MRVDWQRLWWSMRKDFSGWIMFSTLFGFGLNRWVHGTAFESIVAFTLAYLVAKQLPKKR